ncbi:hypothetical protein NDU88_010059 [Pleurodeles waltl]|uniref:Uncharacterized protein n=1 Tax=Pleurodeles waltl TaxID=8319 RepID=A0AAV7PWV9_PLEWA|nr:hypothetical protein NDU88_010059 [Pleurodeles waltl]
MESTRLTLPEVSQGTSLPPGAKGATEAGGVSQGTSLLPEPFVAACRSGRVAGVAGTGVDDACPGTGGTGANVGVTDPSAAAVDYGTGRTRRGGASASTADACGTEPSLDSGSGIGDTGAVAVLALRTLCLLLVG